MVTAGTIGNLVYHITFAADNADAAAFSGTNATFTFHLLATDTAATPDNLTVK